MTAGKILILLLLMGVFVSMIYFSQTDRKIIIQESAGNTLGIDDADYIIEGKLVDMNDGISEVDIDNSTSKIITKYFSSKNIEDINNDAYDDAIVILTQEAGGTDIFYYAALALGYKNGYHGTNAILLGDRIVPQTEEYKKGIITINYTDRAEGQAMSEEPNLGVSKYLSWEDDKLKELIFSSPLITLDYPSVATVISSPLEISGEARGNWYFEGSFPVILTDGDGLIIAEGHAIADGEWMTEDFVPFEASLEFVAPEFGDSGTLILKKDNPSGLPENDNALEIPIFFE